MKDTHHLLTLLNTMVFVWILKGSMNLKI